MPAEEHELEQLRPASFAITYRMLGSVSEAEDVVLGGPDHRRPSRSSRLSTTDGAATGEHASSRRLAAAPVATSRTGADQF